MIKDPYDKLAIRKASVCMFTEIKGRRVTWEITGYCNLRCKHCCINANENFKVFPDFEEVKRIIEEMKEIKVKAIYISGGEPLLWENIYNFIHYSKDVGIEVLSLSTNGVCITPLTAKKLKEAWIDKIQISLDHYEEEKNNMFRGSDIAYETAIRAIKILKENQIFVRVGTVIWKEICNNIERMVEFLIGLNVDEVVFSPLMRVGRAINNPEIFPSQEEFEKVSKRLIELKEKFKDKIEINFHRIEKFKKDALDCKGGVKFFHIDPYGKIGVCSWISKLLPNIYQAGNTYSSHIKELIKHDKIKEFRKIVRKRSKEFGPGCPAACFIENGSILSRDPLLSE